MHQCIVYGKIERYLQDNINENKKLTIESAAEYDKSKRLILNIMSC